MSSRCRWRIGRTFHARKPRDVTIITRHRNSTDQTSFQASMNANLIGFGLQRRWWPFLAPPSPDAANELVCVVGHFPFPHLHGPRTSGHRADASEPTCSKSKAQPLNLTQSVGASGPLVVTMRTASRRNSLVYLIAISYLFIANIARKRPELNRHRSILQSSFSWDVRFFQAGISFD